MKLTPIAIILIFLFAVDILLTVILSILQPEVTVIRSVLSSLELATLVATMSIVVWRVFRTF
jgi:hypothetical protein